MVRFSKTSCASVLVLLVIAAPVWADEPKSVSEIQASHDRVLIRDLLDYLVKSPKAEDVDQAYMKVFDKVIEHDWFTDHEALARKYLVERPDGAVKSLAQIVVTMARASAGKYQDALISYNALITGLGGLDQEEFAVNFADTLANSATGAGEHEVSRRVYEILLKKFGAESPNLTQKVKDEWSRLDRIGKPAPNITVLDIEGSSFRLDDYKGKYVLIDFWATWCAPCVVELPRLQTVYTKYKNKGLEVIAVSLDETKTPVVDFVKARKIPWRVVHNGTSTGDLVDAFGVRAIPATFLIDPKGTIIRLELRGQSLDHALQALMK